MSLTVTRPITQDEVAIFNRDGVVHLRGVLSLTAVNDLRAAIDEAIRTSSDSHAAYNLTRVVRAINNKDFDSLEDLQGGQYNIKALAEMIASSGNAPLQDEASYANDDGGSYHLDSGVAARLSKFRNFSLNEQIGEIVGALMQSSEVRFYDDQIFVKEPGCLERTAFHQDSTYFHIEGSQTCVIWAPVDPANAETGSIQYLRGSHRWNKDFKPNVFVASTAFPDAEGEDLHNQSELENHPDLIQFTCEPGDLVIHHYRTVHGAAGNHSPYQVRRAASLRYCGDDVRYNHRPYAPPQAHHKHNLKDGDPLNAADCFPLIWKAPEQAQVA